MDLYFFGRMVNPELKLTLRRGDEIVAVLFAKDIDESDFADEIIKDWTMGEGTCTVVIE